MAAMDQMDQAGNKAAQGMIEGLVGIGTLGATLANQGDKVEQQVEADIREHAADLDDFGIFGMDVIITNMEESPLYQKLRARGQMHSMVREADGAPRRLELPDHDHFSLMPASLQYALRHRTTHFGQTMGDHGTAGLTVGPSTGHHYYSEMFTQLYGDTRLRGTPRMGEADRTFVVPLHGRPKKIPPSTAAAWVAQRQQDARRAAGGSVGKTATAMEYGDIYGGRWVRQPVGGAFL
mmetsp:Transcript_50378/g.110197  ORF Transcript_50378/g.110197 Transcript_50378/m.110197 type:complete len:236 (+) Transcript_50378:105-812(+)